MAAVGELVELEIGDLSRDGMGVGRIDGQVVFVAGGLPGDTVRVRLTGRTRRHLLGSLQAVISASPQRRRSPCILADHCGGCSLQPLADPAQQQWKQQAVEQALRRLAGLEAPVRPLLGSASGLGYRNRALIPLERQAGRPLRAGYYRRGSHRIVNMNRCPVLDPRLDALIAPLKRDLDASGWPVDRHGGAGDGGGGGLRHLGLRLGSHTGEVLITLIASHGALPGLAELARRWMERWPAVVGVCLNLQPEPTNLLMGPQTRTIAGRGWLLEGFAGLRFRIGADTFFQVHTLQAERVVPLLLEALGPVPGRLLDAYCGIGTFCLPLAAAGWSVHGIEQHPGAVDLARANAAENGLADLASFEQCLVADALAERLADTEWLAAPPPQAAGATNAPGAAGAPAPGATVVLDALFVDPPRKGLDQASLAAIQAQPPPLLLYLSCDPATLARDLGLLCQPGGYQVRWVQPIDFFPNTTHVEALAVLDRA